MRIRLRQQGYSHHGYRRDQGQSLIIVLLISLLTMIMVGSATTALTAAPLPASPFGSVLPSYRPGVRLGDLSTCLPDYAIEAIREALPAFGRTIPGFAMDEALMTAVETRTSSPVRIPRKDDFQSLDTEGLYPAGEGAGYAGGILSAAIDGIKVAEAVALSLAAR